MLVVLALGLAALLVVGFVRRSVPQVSVDGGQQGLGPSTEILVEARETGRGLHGLTVELEQDGTVWPLAERVQRAQPFWKFWGHPVSEESLRVAVGHQEQEGLVAGQATLRVRADRPGMYFGTGRPLTVERIFPVTTQPPTLGVISNQVFVRQGGSALVLYEAGARSVRDGVMVGDLFFPGYDDPQTGARFAYFAAPWDLQDGSTVQLMAEDSVGNQLRLQFLAEFRPRVIKQSRIELSDRFLERVVPAIQAQSEVKTTGTMLDQYLEINRNLRARNDETLLGLSRTAAQEQLWEGAFRQQPGSQVMDAFAAKREYVYNGKVVDHQTHLGYDFASRSRDEVQAANHGIVVLAEYFGIYGNAVVLDHGYGLQSIYAHLSTISVSKGDRVSKGDVLGRSGATGLAGGDHLHFSMMVHGVAVESAEWFDGKWIRDHILVQHSGL